MTDKAAENFGARKFAGKAQAYASSFALLCAGAVEPLLAGVGLGPQTARGVRILDVGTGSGAVARRVDTWGGDVTAIDPDEGMRLLAARAAPHAHVRDGMVPGIPFEDGQFDVVLANFVINHVRDPLRATRDMTRVAASSGRVGATIWTHDRGALGHVWAGVAAAGGVDWPPPPPPITGDFPATTEGLAGLFALAGLADVEAHLLHWDMRIDPDQLWGGVVAGVAGIGGVVAAQPRDMQAHMKTAYDRLVEPYRDGAELSLPTNAVLATGTKP